MIPAWASELISRRVGEFIANIQPHPDNVTLAEVACRRLAWGVYTDMTAALLLNAEGKIYVLGHGSAQEHLVTNSGWRIVAWVHASELEPGLKAVLPPPPKRRVDCANCAGSGRWRFLPTYDIQPCFECWGLKLDGSPTDAK